MLQNTFQLRYYQQDAVNVFTEGGCNNGIIVLPTGTGKSLVISAIAHYFSDKKILVLQPSKEILVQNYEKYQTYSDDASIFSASLNTKEIGRVTFATIGSVVKLQHNILKQFSIIIIDECHLVNKDGQYSDLIRIIQPNKLIGLTATPYRNNTTGIGMRYEMLTRKRDPIFQTITYKYEIQDCIKNGFWSPIKYHTPVEYNASKIQLKGSDYNDVAIAEHNFEIKLHEVIQQTIESSDRKHFLVFLSTITECEYTGKLLQGVGISCREVHSKMPKKERDGILTGFQDGTIKVVLNVGVCTTGFDFPALDCLILGRPTLSLSLYYQMLGRGVRIHSKKSHCDIYDLCGNVKHFGRIETLKFVGDNYKALGLTSEKQILIPPTKTYLNKIGYIGYNNIADTVLKYGKYEGMTVNEVYKQNPSYIDFCIENQTSFTGLFQRFLQEREMAANALMKQI